MRTALISDIHGNELALNAVLDDIQGRGADQTVCLGDVATLGPRPLAVLERLQKLGCACILGNHDEFMFEPSLVADYTRIPVLLEAVAWCRNELPSDAIDFIRSFHGSLKLPLDDRNELLLFHGTPVSNVADLLATTAPEVLDAMLAGQQATVMAGGHTTSRCCGNIGVSCWSILAALVCHSRNTSVEGGPPSCPTPNTLRSNPLGSTSAFSFTELRSTGQRSARPRCPSTTRSVIPSQRCTRNVAASRRGRLRAGHNEAPATCVRSPLAQTAVSVVRMLPAYFQCNRRRAVAVNLRRYRRLNLLE